MPVLRLHAALGALALAVFGASASAATIAVNSSLDVVAVDGLCTLREAIIAANSNLPSGGVAGECAAGDASGQDSIKFDIPGPGPHTIVVQGQLPDIVSSLVINGYTQTGSQENTVVGLTAGFNAVLMIRLTGAASAISRPGLRIAGAEAANVRIHGLEIFGFSSSACCADVGISIGNEARDVEIVGNVIRNNQSRGVIVNAIGGVIENVRIGGPLPTERNLIYGHTSGEGVSLGGCVTCVVENNWIGIARQGSQPIAAGNQIGVFVSGSNLSELRDNWIAGNTDAGVQLFSLQPRAILQHNLIGGAFPNGVGVRISNNGSVAPTDNLLLENIITGNLGVGVAMTNSLPGDALKGNHLRGNRIYANGGLEIDLGADGGGLDGVNPNDPGDLDTGPNGRQNYPVLSAVTVTGGQFSANYVLDSPAGIYDLQFAFGSQCDPSGFGLGGVMLSGAVVRSEMPTSGSVQFTMLAAPATGFVSALASGDDGSSEYGACHPYTFVDPLFAAGFE